MGDVLTVEAYDVMIERGRKRIMLTSLTMYGGIFRIEYSVLTCPKIMYTSCTFGWCGIGACVPGEHSELGVFGWTL